MTVVASIVADLRRAVELLAELDKAAATRTAEALARWLQGEDFDTACGLTPGWRRYLTMKARDAALDALLARRPGLDASALADLIIEGVAGATGEALRPDGEAGLLWDLSRAGACLSARHWRRLISEARGQTADGMATMKVG